MQYSYQYPIACFLSFAATLVSTVLADVIWDSPSAGDVYIPGDTLQAIWSSSNKVVSPSFIVCTGTHRNSTNIDNSTDCGTAVWPSVEQNGTEYSTSLAIPNITRNSNYFLVMKDDRGTMYYTPNFSLALANNASDPNTTTTSNTFQPASTGITYVPSHSSSAAAAIAIPLSLVAVILLVALLLLLFRSRRSWQRERDKENQRQIAQETESRARLNGMNFASATDIERAVFTLSAHNGYRSAPSFVYGPPPIGIGDSYARPGLNAAAALGMGAFGWAHGLGAVASTAPPISDAYTPAPVLRDASYSSASSISRPQSTHGYHEDKARGPAYWSERDWHSSQQTFVDEIPRYCSEPPQLPAIQIYASSPTVQTDVPPPLLPPKQLSPGRLDIHAPRAYTPQCSSSVVSESSLPPTPETEVHTSLNVISNYMQLSPVPPQLHRLYPNEQPSELFGAHVSPPGLSHTQTPVETLPECEQSDKDKELPVRPEENKGTNLYSAVSKAIGSWRS